MARKSPKVYILCEDCHGYTMTQKPSFLKSADSKPWIALKGALFQCRDIDKPSKDVSKLALVSLDDSNNMIEVDHSKVKMIHDQEKVELLLAVPSTNDRYELYVDGQQRLEAALRAVEGTAKVKVDIDNREFDGTLKYRGKLKKGKGVYLGIEIKEPRASGDGTHNGVKHFTCDKNYGLFVSVDKVTFFEDSACAQQNSTETHSQRKSQRISNGKSPFFKIQTFGSLSTGKEVKVFLEFPKKPTREMRGTVRFLGYLDNKDEVYAGVELNEALPKAASPKQGNFYNGQKVFDCKDNTGILVPAETILPAEEFDPEKGDVKEGYQYLSLSDAGSFELHRQDVKTIEPVDIVKSQEQQWTRFEEQKERQKSVAYASPSLLSKQDFDRNMAGNEQVDTPLDPVPAPSSSSGKACYGLRSNVSVTSEGRTPAEVRTLAEEGLLNDSKLVACNIMDANKPAFELVQLSKSNNGVHSHPSPVESDINGRNDRYRSAGVLGSYGSINQAGGNARWEPGVHPNSANLSAAYVSNLVSSDVRYSPASGASTQNISFEVLDAKTAVEKSGRDSMKQPVETSTEFMASGDSSRMEFSKQESISGEHSQTKAIETIESPSGVPSSASISGHQFQVGSVVEVIINGKPMYGVIRWKGLAKKFANEVIAGLELEEAIDQESDGAFLSERYFTCTPGRAFFVKMSCLRPDRRFHSVAPSSSSSSQVSLAESISVAQSQKKVIQTIESPSGFPSSASISGQDFQVGSVVEVIINGTPMYGVIRWKGLTRKYANEVIAGLELEESIDQESDGAFLSERYFTCPPGRAFFVKMSCLRPDRRFHSVAPLSSSSQISVADSTFAAERVCGNLLPPNYLDEKKFIGRHKGIQGHHNSCYMDATLFAMFAFSYQFDCALHRPQRSADIPEYAEVQQVLKESVVNPLRKNGFVSANSVLKLRQWLEHLGDVPGFITEEKDPEEFVSLLFEKVLRLDPFIKLRMESGQESAGHLYQILIEKDESNPLPSVQGLLELSFLNGGLRFAEVPSVLILQMPRSGMQKVYKRIKIDPVLNLRNILHGVDYACSVCGMPAGCYCRDCYGHFGWDSAIPYYCYNCLSISHRHPRRKNHGAPVQISPGSSESVLEDYMELELFAVVCIKTSHYVSFVKCGQGDDERWVFFDSMSDRVGGESGYNIPEVTVCQDLKNWLHGGPLAIAQLSDKSGPEKLLRLFEDASLCFYRNRSLSMYR